jgi:hypothetical protein
VPRPQVEDLLAQAEAGRILATSVVPDNGRKRRTAPLAANSESLEAALVPDPAIRSIQDFAEDVELVPPPDLTDLARHRAVIRRLSSWPHLPESGVIS